MRRKNAGTALYADTLRGLFRQARQARARGDLRLEWASLHVMRSAIARRAHYLLEAAELRWRLMASVARRWPRR